MKPSRRALFPTIATALTVAFVFLVAGCGGGDDETSSEVDQAAGETTETPEAAEAADEAETTEPDVETPEAIEPGATVRLLTHDSFSVSDGLFDNFTLETGIDVEVVNAGDAGELVSRAILTAGQPEADVLFGVDNTFLQRALDADIFTAYESAGLADVPDDLELDPENRVTPIDYGDVCLNYWKDALDGDPPAGMADLTRPEFASTFVTMDPEASSPGFAFLLATIATYGPDGWQDYWRQLADGGVTVTSGWTDAYYGEFVAGGGDKAIVTSYATSPVAEMVFATSDIEEPPTGVVADSCFRQIEFAGVLAGTENPEAAGALIDFMLSETFQADIPLNMFVFPANSTLEPPPSFVEWATEVDDPLILSPAEIEENRSRWTEEWAEIVLR
ncbi:MAG: thiamine ABC transporter substrate-binding protein [Acidimicrobiia bacterium]|nr:thiamine ABC transporter substrate-binding protein [Acidimicrobiia bacterium]